MPKRDISTMIVPALRDVNGPPITQLSDLINSAIDLFLDWIDNGVLRLEFRSNQMHKLKLAYSNDRVQAYKLNRVQLRHEFISTPT